MGKKNSITKRIAGSLMIPVIMFVAMYILCNAKGVTYYGTWMMWKSLIADIAVAATCAFGIGLQFKSGRFDFSGGAIMLVSAIIAGNAAKNANNNLVLFIGLSIGLCVLLSLIVGILYVYGRLPIIIATIGMALLYEATTCLMFGGSGVNLVPNTVLRRFSVYPMVLVPMGGATIVYAFYSYKSTSGKQAAILANNQQSAVNIGVNENKNVIVSYIYSGIIFGFATMIYASTGIHSASFSTLTTVGELFSNILPVFVGLMIGEFCGDTIGTLLASVTLCLMNFGLEAAFSAELGSAISTICVGAFLLMVNVINAQGSSISAFFGKLLHKEAVNQ